MTTTIPEADYREFLWWLLRQRKRLKVTGKSMLPLLQPGEEILINPYSYYKTLPKINDVIVTTHPLYSELTIIKRVTAIDNDGNCFLIGDNLAASTDSRHWGVVNYKNLIGRVTSRFG